MSRLVLFPCLFSAAILCSAPARAQWSIGKLSEARGRLASATVGDLVLFAGGEDPSLAVNSDTVDIYDASLGAPSNPATWSTAKLSVARSRLAGTGVGDLALFAGGGLDSMTQLDVVDVYDATLGAPSNPATWSTYKLSVARAHLAATTVGTKALFAGGGPDTMTPVDTVDIYDASLGAPTNPAAWSTHKLSVARFGLTAITAGTRAIFAGGADKITAQTVLFDTVDIYDASLGAPTNPAAWSVAKLSQARYEPAAAAAGTHAYFAGGALGNGPGLVSDVIDIYDAAFVPPDGPLAWAVDVLPEKRFLLKAAALGNTLIFAGGGDVNGTITPTVHRLNVGTGQWDSSSLLSLARYHMGVATVDGKALFAGGMWEPVGNSQTTDLVDVYEPVGINYCAATTNSTGCAATIGASGSASLAANDLTLSTTCVPDGVFLYFHGAQQLQTPFGNGFRCVGTNIIRIVPAGLASGGTAQVSVDLPSALITSPGLRNFQCWFRDPAAGGGAFDTSDAISITFVP